MKIWTKVKLLQLAPLVFCMFFVFVFLFITISNREKEVLEKPGISYPPSYLLGNAESNDEDIFDENFYREYLSKEVFLLEKFPFSNKYLEMYDKYSFLINNVPLEIVLVNASDFKSTTELYEKIYLSNDATGNTVSKLERVFNGKKFSMVITNLALGPITYMLSGGVIDGDKGYFFRVYLDRGEVYNISEEDFESIFSFDHPRATALVLDILNKFIDEDIPQHKFKLFDDSQLINNPTLDARRRYGDAMPSTF